MIANHRRFLVLLALGCLPIAATPQSGGDEDPEYSRKGADTCLACHDDAVTAAVFHTKHAVPSDPRSPFGHGQLQCEACHGPGGAHAGRVRRGAERAPMPHFASASTSSNEADNGMCLDCHGENIGFAWHSGPHGNDEVACADCHVSHAAQDPVLAIATQSEVCADCHRLQRTDTLKAFGHAIFDGQMGCSACHSVHGEQVGSTMVRASVNDTCFQCHADKRGPYLWEHAPVSEDCGLCHSPHGSNHPGMLTKRAPLLCQSCHAQSGHPSVSYEADGLAGGMPSAYLLGQSCMNCHSQVHGSNHPSGSKLMR